MTVNAITREAGVSRSAFYDQFSDLDALAIDMLAEAFRTYSTVDTDALRAGTPARVAATTALECLVDYLDEHRPFFVSSLEWRTSTPLPKRELVEVIIAQQPGRLLGA